MSKKMKGLFIDPAPHVVFEDAKARIKHQTLMQDYRELQKEAEAMKTKLETVKQRKLTLLAEVRFLRRRYKYLVRNKAVDNPQRREIVQPQNFVTQHKSVVKQKSYSRKKCNVQNLATVSEANKKGRIFSAKESVSRNPNPVIDLNHKDRIRSGKEATLRNKSTIFDLTQKERTYGPKEAAFRNPTSILDSNLKERSHGGKEAALRNPMPILDLNQKERLYGGKDTASRNPFPAFDLNQMERTYSEREDVMQSRAPIFDLNQISGEEELQDNYGTLRIEEPKNFVSRGGTDEQLNDLKLSVCRNVGNGSNRAGKRKISWQDPVALKV